MMFVGMQDGRVLFFSGATGKQILQFQAHSNKVMSIHFVSDDVVITGGFDGTVRRWDITGDRADKPNPSRIIDFYFRDVLVNEYASDQFYSKESFIKDLPTGSFKIYKDTQGELSPVVSVQGDKEKIVAAYQDGDIRIWDTLTCSPWFEIRGRSSQITSIQYDATRLVADGSYSILIVHDFSAAAGEDALRVDQDDGSPTATG
jgi:WD40 repeat protein